MFSITYTEVWSGKLYTTKFNNLDEALEYARYLYEINVSRCIPDVEVV